MKNEKPMIDISFIFEYLVRAYRCLSEAQQYASLDTSKELMQTIDFNENIIALQNKLLKEIMKVQEILK